MTQNEGRRGARRQPRGLQRVAEILDAAGDLFSEFGYEETTTNAIAARAGISPGSLYQFFPNKAAIGNALARRYMEDFLSLWQRLTTPEASALSTPALVDYIIDPLVAFTRGTSGFHALFASADVSSQMEGMVHELHTGIIGYVVKLITARVPNLPADQCTLIAEAIVSIYKAFMPAALDPDMERSERLMGEMKVVLQGYLTSRLDGV